MSEHTPDNPFAFPVPNDANNNGDSGMTLRDWFAGQALAGMLANPNNLRTETFLTMGQDALRFADAMLLARSKGEV